MPLEDIIKLTYILASVLFILGIKMLGSANTARRGNQLSAIGMLLAVVAVLLTRGLAWPWIVGGLVLGGGIGAVLAQRVRMTGMPELVALFNGFGGLASLFVGWAEFIARAELPLIHRVAVALTILIGGITFTGSLVACGRLSGKLGGAATVFKGQQVLNALMALLLLGAGAAFAATGTDVALWAMIGMALLLGVLAVVPIGGGDMPVVIALLNSFSGLAASAAGFAIENTLLIVAGCLVGASGLILTIIMCKAMNRNLADVLFGGFGATANAGASAVEGEMKASSVEDAWYVLEAAQRVVVIPGYGMAVAQAQHAVKELGSLLEENGTEVRYAIHPVAGRMPGHMNVLLAEADVPYEQLAEMDDINALMPSVDVAIVIGANDVVNPAAIEDENSPLYGMPIIHAHEAQTVYALKRGQGAGFSGVANSLFFRPNTQMLYGDAKETVSQLVAQFRD